MATFQLGGNKKIKKIRVAKTICLKIKPQKQILCWDLAVMGEICWRTGEVVLVVMEEEKRSVETFYDCIDLDLEENAFNGDKVGEISNDLLRSQMTQKDPHHAKNDVKMQRKLNESSDTSCENPQIKGISNFRYH